MFDLFIQLDQQIFSAINGLPHTYFSDLFFSFFSGIGSWGLVWIAIGIMLIVWEELKDKRELLTLFLGVVLSLVSVELILKNLIERPRPEFTATATVVGVGLSNSFSFPSSHATIAFASAYILSVKHRKLRVFYYLLAFLISFSRIYLGKHFPSDIVVGAFLGILIGFLSLKITPKLINKL
jgi:undecaprenyl-diphosphatase